MLQHWFLLLFTIPVVGKHISTLVCRLYLLIYGTFNAKLTNSFKRFLTLRATFSIQCLQQRYSVHNQLLITPAKAESWVSQRPHCRLDLDFRHYSYTSTLCSLRVLPKSIINLIILVSEHYSKCTFTNIQYVSVSTVGDPTWLVH